MTTTFPFHGPTSSGGPTFGYPNSFGYTPNFGNFGPSTFGYGTPFGSTPNFSGPQSFWQNSHPWNFGQGFPTFNAYTFGGTPSGFTWNPWTGWTPTWNSSFSPTGYAFPNFTGYANNYGTPNFNYGAPSYGNFNTQNRPYPTYADRGGCCNPTREAA